MTAETPVKIEPALLTIPQVCEHLNIKRAVHTEKYGKRLKGRNYENKKSRCANSGHKKRTTLQILPKGQTGVKP
ncbi:MAG: hypothetical protein ACYSUY_12810 [Planctomycetota bacterium]